MPPSLRILLLADSHLGFDLPERPRVKRRRRGHDFLANYARALEPALRGEVDLVVHAGDVFDRPDVPTTLGYQALEPLRRIAERAIPVFIVPGNHERSRIPHVRFAAHANVHVFDTPRTFVLDVAGTRLALAGFPYQRRNVRGSFQQLLQRSAWTRERFDVALLCVHHCVEGATVGPQNFTFTTGEDVIRVNDIPQSFRAVLSGHIHRHQVLTTDLRKRPVAVPVLYPGSIERTALAEIGEPKGYLLVEVSPDALHWRFHDLGARPMLIRTIVAEGMSPRDFIRATRTVIDAAPADAVLYIRVSGEVSAECARGVSAARLRSYAPETMNVQVLTPAAASERRQRLR